MRLAGCVSRVLTGILSGRVFRQGTMLQLRVAELDEQEIPFHLLASFVIVFRQIELTVVID